MLGGAALIVLSIACGGASEPESAASEALGSKQNGSQAGGDLIPRGRSFADEAPLPDRPDLVADSDDVRGSGAAGQPVGLEGLAESIDPSMLTTDALAENPLEIGVVKRAPFKLAPGADPLDPASYDWEKDGDGYWIISYSDLSLTDVDKDTLLDALVYPEEYEDADEEIQFPDRIRSLDGQKVALTGYMIALKWNKNKLEHFMLVRDLKSCCFGQQPEADEWVDVPMKGEGANYIQYVPVVTRGVFRLAGSSDPAGYAVGAYKIEGEDAREE